MKKQDQRTRRLSGVIDVVRSGKKGFLIREGTENDIEIPMEWLGGALSGDVIEAERARKYGKEMARVVRVIERKKSSFVGTLVKKTGTPAQPSGVYLHPDNTRVYFDFLIEGSAGAPVGNKAIVDVVDWGTAPPRAAVKSVLGVAGDHETEIRAIIAERGFDAAFPRDVLDEAQALYETETPDLWMSNIHRSVREDFRSTLTFTIDPDDAKDFDDAISFKELGEGSLEVGVHIADVSHFVNPKGAIEREAYTRATSVYLVDRTIPMLPPVLSEDLCSLKSDVDRLTFSAVFTVNKNNEVVNRRFTRSIIRSQKRFTYDEADTILNLSEAREIRETKTRVNAPEWSPESPVRSDLQALPERSLKSSAGSEHPYQKELRRLWSFASRLRAERQKNGAIMFDTDEIRPVLDAQKKVIGFKKVVHTESHQLIEELMLLANREVAAYVTKRLGKKNKLFVYRIHDKPDPDRLDELSVFLRAVGYSLSRNQKGVTGQDLNRLLDEVKGTPEEHLIRTATIRSMAKAVYGTKNIGHFGLSFDDYTHFTSPIRRYPDLMVHRALGQLIRGERIAENPAEQEKKAIHASGKEVLAAEAERASIKMKQVEYFANLIGRERAGVVSGITDWGIYISDNETGADGMARIMTLSDDTYEYDPKKFAVVGTTSGKIIRLGDPVTYVVDRVNVEDRTIDFKLVNGA